MGVDRLGDAHNAAAAAKAQSQNLPYQPRYFEAAYSPLRLPGAFKSVISSNATACQRSTTLDAGVSLIQLKDGAWF